MSKVGVGLGVATLSAASVLTANAAVGAKVDPGCGASEATYHAYRLAHPVPEVARLDVFIHQLAGGLVDFGRREDLVSTNAGYNGPRGQIPANYAFVRDYFPFQLSVPDELGGMRPVFVRYLSAITNGAPYTAGATYAPVAPPKPGYELHILEGRHRERRQGWVEVRLLPLFLEGGNLLTTPARLIIGEKVVQMNVLSPLSLQKKLSEGSESPAERTAARQLVESLERNGWQARTREEILTLISDKMSIAKDHILVLPGMPMERTGHVDMFIGTLKGNVVAVPTIPADLIAQLGFAHESKASYQLNSWLDEQVSALQAHGFRVIRVPMLSPKNLVPSPNLYGYLADIPSPVNWQVSGQKVFVPVFPELEKQIPDAMAERMRADLLHTLQAEGFDVAFVDATKLLPTRGLLHCVTSQFDLSSLPLAPY